MTHPHSFTPGTSVVWRSVFPDHVGYVFAARVIIDTDNVIALQQPTGSPVLRRGGARGGPHGRSLLPGGWDGTHQPDTFRAGHVVRAHEPGRPYSIIRRITPDGYAGWYINIELCWRRTPIGFDSRDLTVDVILDNDHANPEWKDLDELDWNRDVGNITATAHTKYVDYGHQAIKDARANRGLFALDWDNALPPITDPTNTLSIPPSATAHHRRTGDRHAPA
ncbi:MAG: DUF402 domain-containing protein [Acidimicrobiales bacterium]